ncbi:hypothetical protein F0562_023495 [Nyssa sinensis]|uniref:Uncharacterized protein n=1 Tax=Nyssa sinensis TaxID=561372 RepID=A0A5J5BJD3_9ASTE|nr:hypothetical protein F0562_023495 [Nyssa sinensis]
MRSHLRQMIPPHSYNWAWSCPTMLLPFSTKSLPNLTMLLRHCPLHHISHTLTATMLVIVHGYIDSKDNNNVINSLWVQHPYSNNNNDNNNNNNPMAMQSQMVASQPLTIQQEAGQDYDEMHPFFDTIDDRLSYIDSKEAYESSSESSLKDTTQSIEHVAENELKSAAACFSLTSVN